MSERGGSVERFHGYGDHVASGVEIGPSKWTGGEPVTDPTYVNKSLKPKRFYYSPIGDGVVAADGVEMKYAPRSTEPIVTVIQQRTVEKSKPGQMGVRIIEKTWSEGGGGLASQKTTNLHDANGYLSSNSDIGGAGNPARMSENNTEPRLITHQMTQQPAPQQHAPIVPQYPAGNEPFIAHKAAAAPQIPISKDYNQPKVQPPTAPKSYSMPLGVNTSSIGNMPYSARSTPNQFAGPYSSATSPLGSGMNRSFNDTPNSVKSFNTSSSLYEPGMRYEIKRNYMVSNPRELIHQYATTTPINTIPGAEHITTQITKQTYQSTVEETTIGGFPPYTTSPNVPNPVKFVRQLRDETMTASQRQANQNQQSYVSPTNQFGDQKIEEIRRQTTRHFSPKSEEIDSLTNRLVNGLNVSSNKHHY